MSELISVSFVASICPELTKAECEAVRDHACDTTSGAVTPNFIRAAARSLFPYQTKPTDNVVQFDNKHYIRTAIKHLQDADADVQKMKSKSDNLAQIQLDIQCCIHYLNEELGDNYA